MPTLRTRAVLLAVASSAALIGGCKPGAANTTTAAAAPGATFQLTSSSSGAAPTTVTMATFNDPTEGAFTMSAPSGWVVQGGIQRASATAATPWLTASSPDDTTTIAMGDPSIPPFTLPSGQHPEGSSVMNGGGVQSLVEPYESGTQFAADYAQRVFAKTCANLQPAGTQAEPALAQAAQADLAKMAGEVGVAAPAFAYDGGSARFTCEVGGETYAVGVIDVTDELQTQAGGVWGVPVMLSYRTPVASQAQVDQLARQMRASFQRQPQWEARMVAATKQQLAAQQQQGQAEEAQLTAQERGESAMLNQHEAQLNGQLNANHQAFMNQFNAKGAARNAAFAQQQYGKETGQQAEMRYINNQQCVQWADAAHTRCAVTAPN